MRPNRLRLTSAATAVVAIIGVALWAERIEGRLGRSEYHTGWILLTLFFVLVSYTLRKRLPGLPLGRASNWLGVHLVTGFASAGVFLLHVGWKLPNGIFEATLAALYCATFVSGVIGLYWSRMIPRQLARVGEEVVYEQIPRLRNQLRKQAEATILNSVRASGDSTLGEFYNRRLRTYFEQRRNRWYQLRPTTTLRKSLMAELTETTRYLSDAERKTSEQLFALVRRRDDLDYHDALQSRLKYWLFVHVGLTYPLLAASCLHGWLAHVFTGALPSGALL